VKGHSRILGFLALPVLALGLFWFAERRPGYFTNQIYLGGILLLEIVAVAVWHYEKAFFPVLMLSFLWAGTDLPLVGAANAVRWVFLFVGALVGVVKWAEGLQRRPFQAIHLMAFLCILSAAVSSMVSAHLPISLLKGASLLLLFLYGSFGARVAVRGREATFFRGLLISCEIASYFTAVLYIGLHFEFLGNPNSLGAVMGVVVAPILLWGVLVADDRGLRQRRAIAFGLASYLLFASLSRAGILACAIAATTLCLALHRGKLLIQGAFALVFLVAALAVLQPARFDALASSFTEDVVYKGKPEQGLLGSRKSPWQDTMAVIRESPWFGSGFGTDRREANAGADSLVATREGSAKEHGTSYLALLQYVGLLGIIPFGILILMVLLMIRRVCLWMWRTRSPYHYAVPLAMMCLAGLVHAIFEDWLFAVGYYLSVFFWTSVFILADLQPPTPQESVVLSSALRVPRGAGRVPLSVGQ